MSYTLFNVPIYNERKAIRSLKRKGYTKITVVARQNFTLTITGRTESPFTATKKKATRKKAI